MYKVSGFLFIGDPHISSKKPGRRKDENFEETILNKLEEIINIANNKDYLPVFLGDLFNRPQEDSESLKTRVTRILNKSRHKCVSNVGNHDITHSSISDEDTLKLLSEAGVLDIITESKVYNTYQVGSRKIALGGTPYGKEIPKDVSNLVGEVDNTIWITHHDLAFDGAYPGSQELFEINKCNLVINGHMHLTKKPITKGKTTWFNPGNITRQALDAIHHTPKVWGFSDDGRIEPIKINYQKDAFNLTGRLVDPKEYSIKEEKDGESVFVKLIEEEMNSEFLKTDDGSIILEKIEEKFEKERTEKTVQHIILNLLKDVVDAQ